MAWKQVDISHPGVDAPSSSETPRSDVDAMASSSSVRRRKGRTVHAGTLDAGSASRLNESAVLEQLAFSQEGARQAQADIQPEPTRGIDMGRGVTVTTGADGSITYTRTNHGSNNDQMTFGAGDHGWTQQGLSEFQHRRMW